MREPWAVDNISVSRTGVERGHGTHPAEFSGLAEFRPAALGVALAAAIAVLIRGGFLASGQHPRTGARRGRQPIGRYDRDSHCRRVARPIALWFTSDRRVRH